MHRKKSFLKILVASFSFFILFASCQQTLPELIQSNYSVIFDYSEEDAENPDSRLSIFMQSDSDVRRYQHIKVTSQETGYIWDFDEISLIKNESSQWAGNTNLKAPENQIIPKGLYEIIYYNADEENEKIQMHINYDSSIYEKTYDEIEDYMTKKSAVKNIAIYDESGILLYYGERNEGLKTVRDIWNVYSNADTYQDIWCLPGNTVICIMKVQKVELENLENKEEQLKD